MRPPLIACCTNCLPPAVTDKPAARQCFQLLSLASWRLRIPRSRACVIVDSTVHCWGKDPNGYITGYAQPQTTDSTPTGTDSFGFGGTTVQFTCADEPLITSTPIQFSPTGASSPEVPVVLMLASAVACVRFAAGGVRCWGEASAEFYAPAFGDGLAGTVRPASQLPTRANIALPTEADGSAFFASHLTSSWNQMCAVSVQGSLACWGPWVCG